MKCAVLIRGGEVIDPSQNLRGVRDVAVDDGRILRVAERITGLDAETTIDARGLFVVPGLVDLHVHVYPHSPWGLDPDPLCAAGGVTTMLDVGTCGSFQFDIFRRQYIDRALPQVLALVNLSCMGLMAFNMGELLDRRYADVPGVIRTIRRHPDVAIGVKIRCSRNLVGDGEQGWASFLDAVQAARESRTWLMIHIGDSPMSVPEMLEHLQPGDCITHCLRSGNTRILDEQNRVYDAVRAAAARGVLFDVGHGLGSFDWKTAEAALEAGFEPSSISTDLHTLNINGPVYDLPATMSKFLLMGMPLERVVELTTARPAAILKQADQIGTLREGTIADIALLEKREGRFRFTDSQRQDRVGRELLTAAVTIRAGRVLPGGGSLSSRRLADAEEVAGDEFGAARPRAAAANLIR